MTRAIPKPTGPASSSLNLQLFGFSSHSGNHAHAQSQNILFKGTGSAPLISLPPTLMVLCGQSCRGKLRRDLTEPDDGGETTDSKSKTVRRSTNVDEAAKCTMQRPSSTRGACALPSSQNCRKLPAISRGRSSSSPIKPLPGRRSLCSLRATAMSHRRRPQFISQLPLSARLRPGRLPSAANPYHVHGPRAVYSPQWNVKDPHRSRSVSPQPPPTRPISIAVSASDNFVPSASPQDFPHHLARPDGSLHSSLGPTRLLISAQSYPRKHLVYLPHSDNTPPTLPP